LRRYIQNKPAEFQTPVEFCFQSKKKSKMWYLWRNYQLLVHGVKSSSILHTFFMIIFAINTYHKCNMYIICLCRNSELLFLYTLYCYTILLLHILCIILYHSFAQIMQFAIRNIWIFVWKTYFLYTDWSQTLCFRKNISENWIVDHITWNIIMNKFGIRCSLIYVLKNFF